MTFLTFVFFLFQVECKKAQPKEVMLPANLAKTRAAGRGAYGELLMLNPGNAVTGTTVTSSAIRYAPYPIPVSANIPVATATGHATIPIIAVAPAPLHYASAAAAAAAAVYDVTGTCKRVYAAPAAALRPMPRPTPALTYSMNDLLAIQGLDIPTLYTNIPPGLGL